MKKRLFGIIFIAMLFLMLSVIAQENSISGCINQNSGYVNNACIHDLAQTSGDISICDQITVSEDIDTCKFILALGSRNPDYCQLLSSKDFQETCTNELKYKSKEILISSMLWFIPLIGIVFSAILMWKKGIKNNLFRFLMLLSVASSSIILSISSMHFNYIPEIQKYFSDNFSSEILFFYLLILVFCAWVGLLWIKSLFSKLSPTEKLSALKKKVLQIYGYMILYFISMGLIVFYGVNPLSWWWGDVGIGILTSIGLGVIIILLCCFSMKYMYPIIKKQPTLWFKALFYLPIAMIIIAVLMIISLMIALNGPLPH